MTLTILLKQYGDSHHGDSEGKKHGQTKVVGTVENSGLYILCWRFFLSGIQGERKRERENERGLASWNDCAMKTQRKNKA